MKIRFRLHTIFLILCYWFILLSAAFQNYAFYNPLKYAGILIIGMYILAHYRILRKKEFLQINVLLLVFSGIVLYASWINRGVVETRDPFLSAIVFSTLLIEFFLMMEITAVKGYAQSMINVFLVLTAVLTIATDVLVFLGITFDNEGGMDYIPGTKFQVMYLHFLWLALYMAKHGHKYRLKLKYRVGMIALILLSLVVSRIVDCTTGFVGAVIFAGVLFVYRRHSDALYKPPVFVGTLIVSFLLSYGLQILTMWNPIEYILVQILDKDITITSRTQIYLRVPVLLRGRYLLGYGYGTTYELGQKLGGFPNTQNALWEWIWQCGILGTVAMLLLIYVVVRYVNKVHSKTNDSKSKYVIMLLYVFSVLAMIEITVDVSYLGYLAMLIPLSNMQEQQVKSARVPWKNRDITSIGGPELGTELLKENDCK